MKYSLQDIDEMRQLTACLIYRERGYPFDENFSRLSPESVELRLRTYLSNGVSVSELSQEVAKTTE